MANLLALAQQLTIWLVGWSVCWLVQEVAYQKSLEKEGNINYNKVAKQQKTNKKVASLQQKDKKMKLP